ncbi:MAG: ComEC/Rec2 family competence protein [Acidimicrobiales bacterium]|nr:ComEC/Rec2 family competence protein [Acidimicrobiales bacterium]
MLGWLRGPAWLRDSLAVTIAAQVGVAPVLVTVFGGIPLVSVPANVLAGPAAGPLMVYGLVGGVVAGIAEAAGSESLAAVVHLPTRALLWWVSAVARAGADAGFGELGGPALAALGVAAGLVAWRRVRQRAAEHVATATVAEPGLAAQTAGLRLSLDESVEVTGRSRRSMVGSLVGGVSVVLVVAALGPAVLAPWRPAELPADATIALATGAVLWTSGSARPAVLVVDGRVRGRELLEVARRKGIRRIPIVVAATASSALADALGSIARRLRPEAVLAPPDAQWKIAGARVPSDRDLLRVDGFTCWLRVRSDRIDLERYRG